MLGNTNGYASSVASATARRQPLANSGRSTYSLTVWISYCPAPMVTVGRPWLTNQFASRTPLENNVVGFSPIDSAARLACSRAGASSGNLNGGYEGWPLNLTSA